MRILTWLAVKIWLFINCVQLQGFFIDSHTLAWVRRMIIYTSVSNIIWNSLVLRHLQLWLVHTLNIYCCPLWFLQTHMRKLRGVKLFYIGPVRPRYRTKNFSSSCWTMGSELNLHVWDVHRNLHVTPVQVFFHVQTYVSWWHACWCMVWVLH